MTSRRMSDSIVSDLEEGEIREDSVPSPKHSPISSSVIKQKGRGRSGDGEWPGSHGSYCAPQPSQSLVDGHPRLYASLPRATGDTRNTKNALGVESQHRPVHENSGHRRADSSPISVSSSADWSATSSQSPSVFMPPDQRPILASQFRIESSRSLSPSEAPFVPRVTLPPRSPYPLGDAQPHHRMSESVDLSNTTRGSSRLRYSTYRSDCRDGILSSANDQGLLISSMNLLPSQPAQADLKIMPPNHTLADSQSQREEWHPIGLYESCSDDKWTQEQIFTDSYRKNRGALATPSKDNVPGGETSEGPGNDLDRKREQ